MRNFAGVTQEPFMVDRIIDW